jgi:hypothetical protein
MKNDKVPGLFSYVVEHDAGFAPHPFGSYCTLAHCKFSRNGKARNIVELAGVEDWILGTGGASTRSAGHGKIVYAMKVTEKMTLAEYQKDKRFVKRRDNFQCDRMTERFVLISEQFYYFGKSNVELGKKFSELEKRGPKFKNRFDSKLILDFTEWIQKNFKTGIHGKSCEGTKIKCKCKTICSK